MNDRKPLRVLVCGSRHWKGYGDIASAIKAVDERCGIQVLIHGNARGADSYACCIAKQRDIPIECYPPDWKTHGRAAGPIRNAKMLAEGKPDLVLAFTHDLEASRGTKDMVTRARAAGVRVVVLPAEREKLMSDDNQEQGINQYGEPWRNDFFAGMPIIVDSSGVIVFETQDEFGEPAMPEDLRLRIVACINACAGIPTEQLSPPLRWRKEPPDKLGMWLVSSGARIVSLNVYLAGDGVRIDSDDEAVLGVYDRDKLLYAGPIEQPPHA